MDNRKRRSNRIDRWLREIGDPERHAPPIDFSEVRCLSQHACCTAEKCPLLKCHTDSGFLRNPTGHATIAPQVASLDPPLRIAKPVTSDSLPTTGSSSSSESLEFTSTESNTELKHSSASSLATSLDSNKMKVIRCELQQRLQTQHQQQSQQHQQKQQHQTQHRNRQSCHGASGDNRVEASGVVSPLGFVAPLAPVIRSSSPPPLPRPIAPQLPQVQMLQLPAPLPPPQLPPQLQLPTQQNQPLQPMRLIQPLQPLQPIFATSARESPPRQLPLPQPPVAPLAPLPPVKHSTSPSSPAPLGEFPSGVCRPSSAAAGVTYYFHLSRHPTSNSGQEQQLLALMRSLHETDPALTQISASRGVSINLGQAVENVAADSASLKRKVVIRGTNWRSVMEAVNDLSLAFPDLMSPSQSTAAAAVAAAAVITGGHATSSSPKCRGHQEKQRRHVVKLPTPPQPLTSVQQPQMLQQNSIVIERQASPPKKIYRTTEKQQPRLSNHQQHTVQQFHQQPQAQHYQSHHILPQHQQKSAQPSASTCYVAASTVSSAGNQQCNAPQQQPPPLPRQEKPRATPKPKLAQNVRFQLTTQQRESLFTQDESGRPTHPRLKHLLTMLGMDLIFLERSVNQEKVPSVKVRFFFESFDQLTAFCKAIDYQIPSQT